MHGAVPEEEKFKGNHKFARYLDKIEKEIIKHSQFIVAVSQKMADFYHTKYPMYCFKSILIPVLTYNMRKPTIAERRPKSRPNLIYSGGTQKWQNIELMLNVYKKIEKQVYFEVFTFDTEGFQDILIKFNLNNKVKCRSVSKTELDRCYHTADFGFILRDDTLLNHISSPTKLLEYMSYGIIPIVLQPEIGDYNSLGYSYLLVDEFLNKPLPTQEYLQKMRENNVKILESISTQVKHGFQSLFYASLQRSGMSQVKTHFKNIGHAAKSHIKSFVSHEINIPKTIIQQANKKDIYFESVRLVDKYLEIAGSIRCSELNNCSIIIALLGKKKKVYLQTLPESISKKLTNFYSISLFNKLNDDIYTLYIGIQPVKPIEAYHLVKTNFRLVTSGKNLTQVDKNLKKIQDQIYVENLKRTIVKQKDHINAIYNSKSWRVTKPLRLFTKLLRFLWSFQKREMTIIRLKKIFYFQRIFKFIKRLLYFGIRTIRYVYRKTVGSLLIVVGSLLIVIDKKLINYRNKGMKGMIANQLNKNKYDILFFSIMDWNTRYQRSQHLCSEFAKRGHRLFYFSTSLYEYKSFYYKQIKENIYEIFLPYGIQSSIYQENISNRLQTIQKHFEDIFNYFSIANPIAASAYPMWYPIIDYLKTKYNIFVVFDILDEFSGFENAHAEIEKLEKKLIRLADSNITSSKSLFDKVELIKSGTTLVSNATEFKYFNKLPHNSLLKAIKKPIIGYYGAIAHWFDASIIEYVADKKQNWSIVLIGEASTDHTQYLRKYPNIHFLGEKSYFELTKYLYWFDVCIIPFKLIDLTFSTSPVKFFEYISSGKPVVSTNLPELEPYKEISYIAKNQKEFLKHIETALQEDSISLSRKRITVAKQNSWNHRFEKLYQVMQKNHPLVSVIIVTYNNLPYTKLCIESVLQNTVYPNYEIIIVDNFSSDATKVYLKDLAKIHKNITVRLNKKNHGFAKANNRGIKLSTGSYVILLNNDTIVTRGWVGGLVKHLLKPEVGIVGPVTNSIGNESRINIRYNNLKKLYIFADTYTHRHINEVLEMYNLALFCVALRRETIDEIGYLDEQYSIGLFEDDDYSTRIRQKGYKLICAEDVFVHHFGSASFSKLKNYSDLFEENLRKFEKKFSLDWIPHKYRHGVKGKPTSFKLTNFTL